MDFIYGFILSVIIAYIAKKKKALTNSGFVAAIIIGTIVYGFGTYVVFTALMIFFISSSIITKLGKESSKDKEGRDYLQVVSNALLITILSIIYYILRDDRIIILALVVIATTTSDTWASEIGKLSSGKTISILTYKTISKGESGGVSLLGIIASLLGSFIIAISSVLLLIVFQGEYNTSIFLYGIIIVFAGFLGSIIDSYLGIIIQEKYFDASGIKVEIVTNRKAFKLASGIPYITNNMVNFLTGILITLVFIVVLF